MFALRAVVRLILAGDELQRRIDLEAIAMASVLVGLGTLTLSLLMVADVFQMSGRQAMLWVLPALWLTYGVTKAWLSRRYR